MTSVHRIVNTPRDYAWGIPGGISAALGWPATDDRQAELWLGAHPGSPSRFAGTGPWTDLAEWERCTGVDLPFLLKVLAAETPLSLQAHPTAAQARAGFERENDEGVPLDAPWRNYKDPHAKPELIVALADGFEALCGFRPLDESVRFVDGAIARATDGAALGRWRDLLAGEDGLRRSVAWLLSGAREVRSLVDELERQAALHPAELPLVRDLAGSYPGDPGIAVAQLLNHLTLSAGQCLWLPAGNIHAYRRGLGVELMGPSDNVLRGGLTPKHVDVAELLAVLDFTAGPTALLDPVEVTPHLSTYRPPQAGFELFMATGDAAVVTQSPSIVMVLDGEFTLGGGAPTRLVRGESAFVPDPGRLSLTGSGHAVLASGSGSR
ncbi:mannose-6-phosphate isomerase, class I [Tessaracoccus lacteus]|uniref:mannose-6-phosphate isomerase n=1 Tax=Tessaracoccus lacteus TaxID=3041766 RepID=A0ABY8PX63_9ACTN|nr:mannose-6-phosphate isomerase, class I [Tessaracoccus sp. T21]WGT47079.1 mannose-6-phosphate isomerase, class I [Tessaracoccus sp. T21]